MVISFYSAYDDVHIGMSISRVFINIKKNFMIREVISDGFCYGERIKSYYFTQKTIERSKKLLLII